MISVQQDNIKKVLGLCLASGVEVLNLGITGGEKFWVAGVLDLSLDEISKAWLAGP